MKMVSNKLRWIDLAILWTIIESLNSQPNDPHPPRQRDLLELGKPPKGLISDFISSVGAGRLYTNPNAMAGYRELAASIDKLRSIGLLVEKGSYYPTETGKTFFTDVVGTDWRRWPLNVPIEDGQIRFDLAQYAPTD